MSDGSSIEWTDATWNPIRGCEKISPGCTHCYAETFAERFRGVPGHPYGRGFDPMLVPGKLADPFRWSASRRVFVNSMSDLFLDRVPDSYIVRVVDVMLRAHWHTYQVLTKRASRERSLLSRELRQAAQASHIWWGVSVENKKHGIPRLLELQQAPVATRFLSVEPLLEDLGELPLQGIHWVIVGGESGHGARPLDPGWVRSIRDQCDDAQVPFFFKQWGGVNKKRTGRTLDGRTHDAMPLVVHAAIPGRAERLAAARELEPADQALVPLESISRRRTAHLG